MFDRNEFESVLKSVRDIPAWRPSAQLAADIHSTKDKVVITVCVPGVERDDVKVNYEDKILTVSATRKQSDDPAILSELWQGTRGRRFELTSGTDDITATLKNGFLTIEVPKRQPDKRSIQVN